MKSNRPAHAPNWADWREYAVDVTAISDRASKSRQRIRAEQRRIAKHRRAKMDGKRTRSW